MRLESHARQEPVQYFSECQWAERFLDGEILFRRCRTFVTMRTAKSGETGTRDRDLASARRPGRQQSHVEQDDLTDAAFESPAKQHWRLLHLVWHLRRTIGDWRTSFGI